MIAHVYVRVVLLSSEYNEPGTESAEKVRLRARPTAASVCEMCANCAAPTRIQPNWADIPMCQKPRKINETSNQQNSTALR
jgi:hypothetical protein